ncbi:lysophospholipid acyltransferase [Physcia stellaris]|nr:lysophospholipid acyltransferase [Physcia stellaris]
MHYTPSLTALAATAIITMVSAQTPTSTVEDITIDFNTIKPGVIYASADHKSILSDLAAKVSAQLTNSAFQAELSKIPEAKGHNLESDVTKAVAQALWSAWMTALPTTGYGYVAINNDIVHAFQSEIKAATSIGTFTGPNDVESTLISSHSIEAAAESRSNAAVLHSFESSVAAKASSITHGPASLVSSLTSSLLSEESSITHAPAAKASSFTSSLASKESSLASKVSSVVSTSSSTAAAAQAQVTGVGVVGMGVGAVVGGAWVGGLF